MESAINTAGIPDIHCHQCDDLIESSQADLNFEAVCSCKAVSISMGLKGYLVVVGDPQKFTAIFPDSSEDE